MAYNKFKRLAQLQEMFALSYSLESFLPVCQPFAASERVLLDLADAMQISLKTEKAKSELIVVPILKELLRSPKHNFSYFSGFSLEVDAKSGLTGYCDFLLSAQARQIEVNAPIFCLVEAKKDNIEDGLAQCGAEMYAAQIFNEREGNPRETIYGCVTNAFSWCFLKLNKKTLYIDPNYVPLTFTEPHRVLATLQWILDEALGEGNKKKI